MNKKLINQIVKFAIVGVVNTVVDLYVLNVLIGATNSGRSGWLYALFQGIAFIAALINSYYMNKYWTFSGQGTSNRAIEVSEFTIISIIGFLLNVGSASLVATFVPPIIVSAALWPSAAALVGTAVGLVWNFLGYKFVVFEKKRR